MEPEDIKPSKISQPHKDTHTSLLHTLKKSKIVSSLGILLIKLMFSTLGKVPGLQSMVHTAVTHFVFLFRNYLIFLQSMFTTIHAQFLSIFTSV